MALLNLKKDVLTFVLVGILALANPSNVMSQNCGCAADLCCSKFGYCGTGDQYCGDGCQQGPCNSSPTPTPPTPSGGGGSVADIVTTEFFDGIKNKADASCAGKTFYTRDGFLNAANAFPDFGKGSADESKREIAAFFAHVTHETGHLCYTEEINKSDRYCDESNTQYPCAPGKFYYGRGPMQLSWNYNYGACGKDIGIDLLNSPETVSKDPAVAFKTAFWFWMNNVHPVLNQGFGATIRKINGALECDGKKPELVQARIGYYTDYCNKFGVSPGENLSC